MFFLEYQQHILLNDDGPNRFVTSINGTIGKYDHEAETASIGEFRIFIIDVESALNEREPLDRVFDTDHAIVDYYNLYTPTLDFNENVCRAAKIEHQWEPNLLILDRLAIYPEHRGQGHALYVLQGLIRRFAMGCGLVAMKPYPLQFENGGSAQNSENDDFIKMRLNHFSGNFNKSQKRLQNYYAEIGFVRVRGSELMVADPLHFAVKPSLHKKLRETGEGS